MVTGFDQRSITRAQGRLVITLLLLALPLTAGCARWYFREAPPPPQPPTRHSLQAWPYHEYWTGVVFNGEKVGLTHLALIPPGAAGGQYELRSEALLAFHFLGFTKHVTLKAQDWVADDLRLERFVHEYDLDGNKMTLAGRVENGRLLVEREAGGRASQETISVAEALYPTSAMVLYPTWQGLEVGRQYAYQVYNGQRQQVARVSQSVEAYQESDLYVGRAFQIVTTMDGQEQTTWLNERGEPVLEMAWKGILISTLESEQQAKAYLAQASLNKRDVLVEFSRVRTNRPLPHPQAVRMLHIVIEGLPDTFPVPLDHWQQCGRDRQMKGRVECVLRSAEPPSPAPPPDALNQALQPYVEPTASIDSRHPLVLKTARDIVGSNADQVVAIRSLVAWLRQEIEQTPVDVFSSLEVLQGRKAECQGVTLLYAAFARSLGIPTKVANGLVYSQELGGFLYHTWAESYVNGGWLPVDPTFGQVGVDATHIKLLEGERLADLLPLADIVGRVRIEILSSQPS
jgi:transglutaminase-like putative cysteine protease